MAYTLTQIDAIISTLESSLASGTAEVQFEGRRVRYHGVDQIVKAIAYFQGLRASLLGSSAPVRVTRLYSGSEC